MGSGSATRIDVPERFAMAYRLVFGYAFVRRKSEQNSSLQLLKAQQSRPYDPVHWAHKLRSYGHHLFEPLPQWVN